MPLFSCTQTLHVSSFFAGQPGSPSKEEEEALPGCAGATSSMPCLLLATATTAGDERDVLYSLFGVHAGAGGALPSVAFAIAPRIRWRARLCRLCGRASLESNDALRATCHSAPLKRERQFLPLFLLLSRAAGLPPSSSSR